MEAEKRPVQREIIIQKRTVVQSITSHTKWKCYFFLVMTLTAKSNELKQRVEKKRLCQFWLRVLIEMLKKNAITAHWTLNFRRITEAEKATKFINLLQWSRAGTRKTTEQSDKWPPDANNIQKLNFFRYYYCWFCVRVFCCCCCNVNYCLENCPLYSCSGFFFYDIITCKRS